MEKKAEGMKVGLADVNRERDVSASHKNQLFSELADLGHFATVEEFEKIYSRYKGSIDSDVNAKKTFIKVFVDKCIIQPSVKYVDDYDKPKKVANESLPIKEKGTLPDELNIGVDKRKMVYEQKAVIEVTPSVLKDRAILYYYAELMDWDFNICFNAFTNVEILTEIIRTGIVKMSIYARMARRL